MCSWMNVESRIVAHATWDNWFNGLAEQAERTPAKAKMRTTNGQVQRRCEERRSVVDPIDKKVESSRRKSEMRRKMHVQKKNGKEE